MKKLFAYLNILIGFLMFSLIIAIFEIGFKLITTIFSISHDLIYSEENTIAQLFLNKINDYPNIITEVFFRGVKLILLIYLLLKFADFKSIIPELKNRIFFTTKNHKAIKQLGKALIVFSIIFSILKIFDSIIRTLHKQDSIILNIGAFVGESIGGRLPLLIMGLLLLIIARFINEGFGIKQENELTI